MTFHDDFFNSEMRFKSLFYKSSLIKTTLHLRIFQNRYLSFLIIIYRGKDIETKLSVLFCMNALQTVSKVLHIDWLKS